MNAVHLGTHFRKSAKFGKLAITQGKIRVEGNKTSISKAQHFLFVRSI